MIIIEKPYASDFLKETLIKHRLPVLQTTIAEQMLGQGDYHFISPAALIASARKDVPLNIYTPSENAIQWIADNLSFTPLPGQINFFKDKIAFRQLTGAMYPDFGYQAIDYKDLEGMDTDTLFFPMILKPAVGFFSMGVYKVHDDAEWAGVVGKINADLEFLKDLYPEAVLDTTRFIAEEIIEGEEYAVDAYFDSEGEVVILGMMKHIFGSDADVSDRVYYTSGSIVEKYYAPFHHFISEIGKLTGLKNFPLHVEIRVDDNANIVPVEVNPLRFGGWCTSADLMYKAYGFNPYLCFCKGLRPDWEQLVKKDPDKMFSIIILDRPAGIHPASIAGFDYDAVLKTLEKPLELRKADYRKYPQFGFLFAETRSENFAELERILKADLSQYITTAKQQYAESTTAK